MCGIAGELRIDGNQSNPSLMDKMLQRLERRGPDFGAMWSDNRVILGHRRLAVIDLTAQSNQPLVNSGLVLVFNGTIYNYRSLRSILETHGHQFTSDGDTEVIIKAYVQWGELCVTKFIGVFAFAIWDQTKQQLFLARDRIGIKPLYYTQNKFSFYFASNTQALLEIDEIDTNIDPIALHYQLTLHSVVPAPHTIIQGIRKLEPATTLTIKATGSVKKQCYWHLRDTWQRSPVVLSKLDWINSIHDALYRAVKRRVETSDVPVGILLSGGLDSSLLVALMARETNKFCTFSIGFDDYPEEKGSEFEYSAAVAALYQTKHTQYLVNNNVILERLPEVIGLMSEPMVGQDAVAFFLLSEQVSKSVKVVQSGQGADELFAGYFWYQQIINDSSNDDLESFRSHYFDRSHTEWLDTVDPQYHVPDYSSTFIAQGLADFTVSNKMSRIDKILSLDITKLVVDDPVKRVENMTAVCGLEARMPFLDHELVELAIQLPYVLKAGKYVLKEIARGLLPTHIVDRKKSYFPVPALKFVRGNTLDFMRDIVSSHVCQERRLFQRTYLDKLIKSPTLYMTKLLGSKLWHVALLELWLQINIDHRKSRT